MFGVTTSDDYRPVAWMGRYPVDVTTMLVGTHVALAILTCIFFAAGASWVLDYLHFDSAQVLYRAQVWRIATYAFVHAPQALLWFAIEMYMLFVFGREVERFIGQRAYVVLYAILLLAPTLVLATWGIWQRSGLAGSPALHFGVFVAFATIYPNVEMFLRIQMKWVALIFVAIGMLAALANRDWTSLIVLWATIITAVSFVRLRGAGPELEWWNNVKSRLQPKPKFQVVPRTTPRRTVEPENIHESIDPVLEKI